MREHLIAYIEGTLSPRERRDVLYHLQHSKSWQREWHEVQKVQSCLSDSASWHELGAAPKLDSLLPAILDRAKRPIPRYHYWWKGLQLMLVMSCLFGSLLMIPLLLGESTTANAQNGWSPNNPINTSTHTHTPEGMAAVPHFAALQKTQEPELNTRHRIVLEFGLGSATQVQATMARCEAASSGSIGFHAVGADR